MNRDDVLKAAARGCGFDLHWHRDGKLHINMGQLERFAAAMYSAGIESAKADVLRIAGEPVAALRVFMTTHDMGQSLTPNPPFKVEIASAKACAKSLAVGDYPLYTEAQLLAMYAKGAEAMREQAALACDEQADEPECQERAEYCADAIRSLPITHTNTEGEQG